jgi:hypothetical protein
MAKKTRRQEWFVFPKNDNTNRRIAELLEGENTQEIPCNDGNSLPMWPCDFPKLKSIWRSNHDANLEFQVFNRSTPHSPVRDITNLREKIIGS